MFGTRRVVSSLRIALFVPVGAAELVDAALEAAAKATKAGAVAARAGKGVDAGSKKNGGGSGGEGETASHTTAFAW